MRALLRLLLVFSASSRVALGVTPPEAARVFVGGVPSRVAESRDLGPADGDLPLSRIVLLLAPRDPAGLETFLARLQDPTCPEFHRWVSPEEFGRRFGAPTADIDRVTAWLSAQRLTVIGPNAGRTVLLFSGRLADVAQALQTEFRNLEWNGEPHVANVTVPTIPGEVSGLVRGVLSLDDFRRARPVFTSATTGLHYLAPADFAAIYDLEPLYAAGIDGRGATIAIVGASHIDPSDISLSGFRQTYGIVPGEPTVVLAGPDPGLNSAGYYFEACLDLEWSGAVAPAARQVFVVSAGGLPEGDADLAALTAVDGNLGDILSLSFVWCEHDSTPDYLAYYSNLWAQAAAQGISVLVASGDWGVLGCTGPETGFGSDALSINALGSSPYCTCVGGTQFNEGDGTYWNATNDPVTKRSVTGPIPEIASSISGGGLSAVFARPAWQNVPGLAPGPNRAVPDVALTASQHDAYLVTIHSNSGEASGGTSASAPAFAGIVALLEQKLGGRLGNLNPMLYALGRAQYGGGGATPFRDVTVGDNSYGGVTGYQAGPGYDLVTGLGSVDAEAFVNSFAISSGPVANFTFALAPNSEGQTLQFTDRSTGGPTSWSWNFGDGGTSTLENPSHTFATGTYQVSLTVSNSGGSSSKTQAVVVSLHHGIAQPPPVPFHPEKRPTP